LTRLNGHPELTPATPSAALAMRNAVPVNSDAEGEMIDQSDNKFIALANVESGARGDPLRVPGWYSNA